MAAKGKTGTKGAAKAGTKTAAKNQKKEKKQRSPETKKKILIGVGVAALVIIILLLIRGCRSSIRQKDKTYAITYAMKNAEKGEYDRALDKLEDFLNKYGDDEDINNLWNLILDQKQNDGNGMSILDSQAMKDYLDADSVNGRIFGVPTLRSYVTNGYVCFQKDALDELGLTEKAQNLDSWSGLEEILGKLAEANKGTSRYAFCGGIGTVIACTGYMIHGDKWSDIEVVDTLGDSANVIYADKEGHVSLAQKQESFIEACKIAKEWMDNGWIFPDSIYDSAMSAQETIGAGGALIEICTSEIGLEAMNQQIYKAPALCVKLYTGNIKTGTLTGWGMGLPVTCEEPEGAVKLINMLYTNSDLMKVLVNGEEGVDYELVDGQAKQIENQFSQGNFIYGNNLLTLPVYGTGADLYERVDKMNKEAECSPYLGFNLNTADLDLVLSQINAVTDQYRCAIASGGYSDAYFNEYMEKLEAAGVQDYIDAVQAQLSAWMESK